jgi:hypothetical protein
MMRFGVALFEIGCSVGGTIPGDAALRMHWCEGIISATDIAGAAPAPNFVPAASIPTPIGTPPFTGAAGTSDDADAAAFRAVLIALLNGMQPTSTLPTPTAIGDLTTCKTQFVASLSPQTTVPARFTKRLSHPSLTWSPKDPIEPIFAPPGFGRPMYAPLAEVSKDWILPGINEVGRNTAAIAMTNRRFIEAYMAGLNDEMTRALQWNEFPVDQRGTYFQQFWDITGIVPPQVGTIDILPVASWGTTANLGGNGPSGGTEHIVLVIRAQLIQRYPNVIVYAIQGQTNGSSVGLGTTEKYPIFNALIGPDVAFYGFDIPVSDARGNPGWFFVLAEQPGEPKFAAASGTSPGVLTPPTGQTTAAMVANKLFLNPFRIAFHGSVLLPSS